jgi:glycosyltransferase involved in cell wall biosynthesis
MPYQLPIITESLMPMDKKAVENLIIPKVETKDVGIVFDSFLRDKLVFNLIESICKYAPGYRMYIADQGIFDPIKNLLYQRLEEKGHKIIYCGFDSGVARCRNEAIKQATEPYVFLCDGDNIFIPQTNLEKLKDLMKSRFTLYWLAGLEVIDDKPMYYENNLAIKDRVVHYTSQTEEFKKSNKDVFMVDMTMNQGLVKTKLFNIVKYDSRMMLAEHLDLFLQIQTKTKYKVGITKLSSIGNQNIKIDNPIYNKYRGRNKLFWQYYIEKWGIDYVNDWKIETPDNKLEYILVEEKPIIPLPIVPIKPVTPIVKTEIVMVKQPLIPIIPKPIPTILKRSEPYNEVTQALLDFALILDSNEKDYYLLKGTCLNYLLHKPLLNKVYIGLALNKFITEILVKKGYEQNAANIFRKNGIDFIIESYIPSRFKEGNALEGKNFKVPYPAVAYLTEQFGKDWAITILKE